jgi:hypothetical protein
MPSHRSPEDEAAIRLARLTQTRAISAGDLDTVVRYWTAQGNSSTSARLSPSK